jgi:hypothetical protein
MKKHKLFLTILTLCLIFSCSSDDDNSNSVDSTDIVGKWVITKLAFEDYYQYPECAINNNTYEILDNDNLIYNYITGNNCNQTGTINLKYTFEGNNKIVIIRPNGGYNPENDLIEKYTIKTLTNTQLILELYYVDEGDDNGAGIIDISQEDRREEIWEKIN